ncbi:SA1002 family membrane protein, partial [Burkholderia multivorans]
MTVVGMVIVIIMLGLYIGGVALLDISLGLFLGVISVALASGIVMFLIVQPIIQRTGISAELLTITEYYIQWFLIYVTVYQVIFEQLNGLGRVINERDVTQELNSYLSSVLNPSALIAILLPVLLSIWVAVA